jgi:hypothetical protein
MTDFTPPDCKIFVDADLSETELVSLVSQLLTEPGVEVNLIRNEDYDLKRRKQFPGGFIYFRYVIDLYLDDPARADKAAIVASLLDGLWAWGFAAIAACGYEEQLPHNGGYRSHNVPWPE